MSYAIVRNEKLTRTKAQGICVHNDRKAKNHTNKDIDSERTRLNYYFKKNNLNYVKEFDKLKKENDLKGNIRSNSIIMCEMLFTSDSDFFEKIGEKETKRYFEESFKFICNYKDLGEENILSAVVHLDEGVPHMHLVYVPVIHTKDKEGNDIDKICARDFWKGRDSYRQLQNAYYEYVTSKGFDLERGLPFEETGAKHERIEDLKKLTNFENTKNVLNNIKLELPEVPDINDIKLIKLNREKVENEIIKPKDDLITKLYNENALFHKELQNTVENLKQEYEEKNYKLEIDFINRRKELENEFKEKEFAFEYKYKNKIRKLEKENTHLHKVVDKFYETVDKFINWICSKFGIGESKELIKHFENDTNTLIDPVKQLEHEEREKEWDLEM